LQGCTLTRPSLPFRQDLDPRPLPPPAFIPLPRSQQALLILPSSLLLISLSTSKSFEEQLLLKDSARNAFLGVGTIGGAAGEVGIVMKAGGFACMTVAPLGSSNAEGSGKDADTRQLKSRLEQAIFFGTNASNPLSFDLTPSLPGSLLASTAQLSAQILSSSLPLLPPVLDTRLSLAARLQSLTHLVELVGRCGLMGKLSASARRSLLADAERLSAGGEAWTHLTSRMTYVAYLPLRVMLRVIAS
jgi:nuclear pore complex protein Nup133